MPRPQRQRGRGPCARERPRGDRGTGKVAGKCACVLGGGRAFVNAQPTHRDDDFGP